MTEPLPDASLDPISHHRPANPSPDGHAEPGSLYGAPCRSRCNDENEGPTGLAPALPGKPLKFSGATQAIRPFEAGHVGAHRYLVGVETASRLRPFDRRRFRTARPPRVFIRARKP